MNDRSCNQLDYSDWGRSLAKKAVAERRPIAGYIAFTYRCNLRCVHCYLQDYRDWKELSTHSWKGILDQLEQAGCLWLTITGGEPLIRPDFQEIYIYAKKKGFLISVFTNGTMINDALVGLWSEWTPHLVEISVYGYSENVYREVTGVEAAREKCFIAIDALKRAGIPMRLKTMVLGQNENELDRLKSYCEELEVPFRYDPMVSPTLLGCQEPCVSELSLERIVGFDVEDRKRYQSWSDILRSVGDLPAKEKLFNCLAGKNSFFIYPDGGLSLCPYDMPVFDLAKGSFQDGWNGAVKKRIEMSLPEDHPCRECMDLVYCTYCAPVARMETGSEYGISAKHCWLAKERRRLFELNVPC